MKPGASFRQTTVSLPYRSARSSATASVSSEVSTPRTISISRITGAGLNQWLPITRSGRPEAAAEREIENCEVFVAKTTSSRQTLAEASQHVLLDVEVLDDGLDHVVGALGGLLERRRRPDARQRRRGVGLAQRALRVQPGIAARDPGQGAIQGRRRRRRRA